MHILGGSDGGFELSKSGDIIIYGATFVFDEYEGWDVIVNVLPKLNTLIESRGLISDVHFSYAALNFSASFTTTDEITENHIQAAKEIEAILNRAHEHWVAENS